MQLHPNAHTATVGRQDPVACFPRRSQHLPSYLSTDLPPSGRRLELLTCAVVERVPAREASLREKRLCCARLCSQCLRISLCIFWGLNLEQTAAFAIDALGQHEQYDRAHPPARPAGVHALLPCEGTDILGRLTVPSLLLLLLCSVVYLKTAQPFTNPCRHLDRLQTQPHRSVGHSPHRRRTSS